MKVYSKDPRLKMVDAVDRRMARQEVAQTREAHRGDHPPSRRALIIQAEVRSGIVFTL